MKMAKASEADLRMAMELCNALDGLVSHWGARLPEAIEQPKGESESEFLDPDDGEQCKRIVAYLRELAGRASLMRVVWGMTVLLDPRNEVTDPGADTLEHHPKTVAAKADSVRLQALIDHGWMSLSINDPATVRADIDELMAQAAAS